MNVKPIRILIVDDDEDDFFILSQYLNKIEGAKFILDWCNIYSEAANKICGATHDLYFIDYVLGSRTGLELIKESIENNCEEPFILLTGNGNRLIDLKAMESGAVDYLIKGELTVEKLERCIRYSLERASSLKALRASESKFRNIFEQSKDTVFVADEDLVFTEINTASFHLLEYKREELLSKSLYELLVNKNDISSIRQQLATSGDVSDKEVDIRTKNADKKSCILTLSKEKDKKGVLYIQGIMHDITSLKREEQENLMLEKMGVANRLIRIMAHEVRNPLNNIVLSTEQLEQSVGDKDSQICLDIIKRNSKRISDIISELLKPTNPGELSTEKKSLQSIIDETLEAAIDRINLRNIQVQKDYMNSPAYIMADMEKLKIALLNIIINAVEAMEDKAGKLTISIKQKEQQYIVTIEDNGCGISEENLSRLFEPYFTSKQKGMGLGLVSTLNILKYHNASIHVQSVIDKGTVFKLNFNSVT